MRTLSSFVAMASLSLALAGPAQAETFYKLIDKKGRVTYVNEPPRDFDGQVIKVEINAGKQTQTFDPKSAGFSVPEKPKTPAERASSLKDAEEKLEMQRKRLQNARDNPGPEDVTFVRNVGGGTRRVESEAFQRRIADIEAAVKSAEEEVERARKAR